MSRPAKHTCCWLKKREHDVDHIMTTMSKSKSMCCAQRTLAIQWQHAVLRYLAIRVEEGAGIAVQVIGVPHHGTNDAICCAR